jgi:hypothetical protein
MEIMRPNRIFPILGVAVILLSAWLLAYTFVGYGHVVIHAPSGATVQINGHEVAANTSLKLRPGTYHITTLSAQNYSRDDSVTVHLLQSKDFTPSLTKRSITSIANSAVGVSAQSDIVPSAFNPHWFGEDWVVMEYGASTPDVLAAHYEHGRWQKAHLTGDSQTNVPLPADVAATVTSLEGSINASIQ